jgi:hypothetical protein
MTTVVESLAEAVAQGLVSPTVQSRTEYEDKASENPDGSPHASEWRDIIRSVKNLEQMLAGTT